MPGDECSARGDGESLRASPSAGLFPRVLCSPSGTPSLPVWGGSTGAATLTGLSCVSLQPPERRGAGSRVLLAAGGAGGGGDGAGGVHPVPAAGQEQMRAALHPVPPVTPAPCPQRRPGEGPCLKLAPGRKSSFAPSLDCRTSEARPPSTSRTNLWHQPASPCGLLAPVATGQAALPGGLCLTSSWRITLIFYSVQFF